MLSSLGGWLDARGDWKVPNGLSVEQWVHHAAQARDHYVRVIYKGYCLPFGHRVSLVKVSERFFLKDQPGNAAYVLQRMFFIVREPVREFPETKLFKMVGGKPQLLPPRLPVPRGAPAHRGHARHRRPHQHRDQRPWPGAVLAGAAPSGGGPEPFRFQYEATDLDGNQVRFDLPAIFIDNALANPAQGEWAGQLPARAATTGSGLAHETRRTTTLQRQKVALAPSAKPGDTANEIEEIVVRRRDRRPARQASQARLMRPSMHPGPVRLPSIGALTGGAGNNVLRYEEGFLALARPASVPARSTPSSTLAARRSTSRVAATAPAVSCSPALRPPACRARRARFPATRRKWLRGSSSPPTSSAASRRCCLAASRWASWSRQIAGPGRLRRDAQLRHRGVARGRGAVQQPRPARQGGRSDRWAW